MEDAKRNLIKNFLYLVVTKGIDFVVPVVLLPFLVSKLGLETFGLLSFSLAIGVYFSSIMQYGYNISAVRAISRVRGDFEILSQTFSALFVSSLLICISLSCIYLLMFFFEEINNEALLYLSVLFFIFMQSVFPAWLFQGLEKMHFIAIINGLCKLLYFCAVLVLVHAEEDVYLVPLLQGMSGFIALLTAVYLIFTKKIVTFKMPSVESILRTYVDGWSAFVTQFSPTLYSNSATFLLGLFHGNTIAGIYSAAIRIIEICNAFGFLLVNAAIPQLARNISFHVWLKRIMLIAGIALGISIFLLSSYISELLFSTNVEQITTILSIVAPMIPLVFMRLSHGPAYLMLVGKEKTYQKIVFMISLLGFVCSLLFIPLFSAIGASWVLLFIAIIMTLLTVNESHQYSKKQLEGRIG